MATETKPEVIKLDWEKAKLHLQDVELFLKSFVGKEGYNPFFELTTKIEPLKSYLNNPKLDVNNKDLYDAIMSLKKDEPKIIKNYVSNIPVK